MQLFQKSLALDDRPPETHYNLALALSQLGRFEEGRKGLEHSVKLRPNLHLGWFYLARIADKHEDWRQAEDAYRRVLSIQPDHTRSYAGMVKVLKAQGKTKQAESYRKHGLKHAARVEQLRELLGKQED